MSNVYHCVGCEFKSDKMYAVIAHYQVNPKHKKKTQQKKKKVWTAEKQAAEKEFNKNILITIVFFAAMILFILGIQLFRVQ